MTWEDVHFDLLGCHVQGSGRLRATEQYISQVRLGERYQTTYCRVTEWREGRTAMAGVFKMPVRGQMNIMIRFGAKVDLHDYKKDDYNSR